MNYDRPRMNIDIDNIPRNVSGGPNPYEQMGGEAGVRRLVTDFYDLMDASPEAIELRRMHARDLTPMRQTLIEFLSGWLGGPRTYFERTNINCMMATHAGMRIGHREAEQWLWCMRHALDKLAIDEQTRDYVAGAFTRICRAMVNRND